MGQGGSGGAPGGSECAPFGALPNSTWQLGQDPDYYFTFMSPNYELQAYDDYIVLEFFEATTGTFTLGAGVDDNYATCGRCFLAFVDLLGDDTRRFFASSGTLTITDSSTPTSGLLDATLTDVTLVEVSIDEDTAETTPVPDGACLHVPSLRVVYPPP